jgi:hypothetical protein
MRFMIIVKASPDSEAGVMPSSELIAEMGRFNEELIEAGVLLAGEGLQSSAKGKRVKLEDGKFVVKDRGPRQPDDGLQRGDGEGRRAHRRRRADAVVTGP